MSVSDRVKDRMLLLLKRHQAQILLAADHDQIDVARLAGCPYGECGALPQNPRSSTLITARREANAGSGDGAKWRCSVLVQRLVEEVDEETHARLTSVNCEQSPQNRLIQGRHPARPVMLTFAALRTQ